MAVYWDLGAACASEAAAQNFAKWFEHREIPLSDGTKVGFKTSVTPRHDLWMVWIWPLGMAYASPFGSRYDLVDTDLRYEIEEWIYDRLEECPPFEYAFFGGEAHERLLDEPLAEILDDPNYIPAAFVIATASYDRAGRPPGFAPFSDGYLWNIE